MIELSKRDKAPEGYGFIYAAYSGGGLVKVGKTMLSPQSRLTKIRGRAKARPFWDMCLETMELVPPILRCPLQVHHQAERQALTFAGKIFEPLSAIGNEYFRAAPFESRARMGFDYESFFSYLLEEIQDATLHRLSDVDLRWERGDDSGVCIIGAPMGAGSRPRGWRPLV